MVSNSCLPVQSCNPPLCSPKCWVHQDSHEQSHSFYAVLMPFWFCFRILLISGLFFLPGQVLCLILEWGLMGLQSYIWLGMGGTKQGEAMWGILQPLPPMETNSFVPSPHAVLVTRTARSIFCLWCLREGKDRLYQYKPLPNPDPCLFPKLCLRTIFYT